MFTTQNESISRTLHSDWWLPPSLVSTSLLEPAHRLLFFQSSLQVVDFDSFLLVSAGLEVFFVPHLSPPGGY